MFGNAGLVVIAVVAVIILGIFALIMSLYRKVAQGKAMVKTGMGGVKVSFNGMTIIPILHKLEIMDISVKKVEISRLGKDGLICKDNIRADIKVAFFVRVNPKEEDVKKVAQNIGCERASDIATLNTLFEAKFSEALKTVGKKFDFIELYNSRAEFKAEIIEIIGRDLNGYALDDCAIDYLEQTPLQFLKADNILDAEGIKKITELTANQNIKANDIRREEEKTITQQDVEAKEAILELNRQLAEKEERQKREIANIKSREHAEITKVQEEETLKSERARISKEEEIGVAEANKERQIIVANKNRDRTEVVENERVEKDRLLEVNEKERIVTLAQIEKEKSIEEERKQIQDIIKERIAVDKKVAEEEEKIKDLRAISEAERFKQVALKEAEMTGESLVIQTTKKAEADKLAAEINARKLVIDAEAQKEAALKEAEARKINAEALAAEEATIGLSEAQVTEAKANATKQVGLAEAEVIEKKAIAEANGLKIKAEAERELGLVKAEILKEQGLAQAEVTQKQGDAKAEVLKKQGLAQAEVTQKQGNAKAEVAEKQGLAEAKVIEQKVLAEAKGLEQRGLAEAKVIEQKVLAEAKGIEEYGLAEAKVIEQKVLAEAQGTEQQGLAEAKVIEQKALAEAKGVEEKALAMQKLDAVGKEHEEFKLRLDKEKEIELAQISIQKDLAQAQATILGEALKSANIDIVGGEAEFFNNMMKAINQGKSVDRLMNASQHLTDVKNAVIGNGNLMENIKGLVGESGISSNDIKNLTLASLLFKLQNDDNKGMVGQLLETVKSLGLDGLAASKFLS